MVKCYFFELRFSWQVHMSLNCLWPRILESYTKVRHLQTRHYVGLNRFFSHPSPFWSSSVTSWSCSTPVEGNHSEPVYIEFSPLFVTEPPDPNVLRMWFEWRRDDSHSFHQSLGSKTSPTVNFVPWSETDTEILTIPSKGTRVQKLGTSDGWS